MFRFRLGGYIEMKCGWFHRKKKWPRLSKWRVFYVRGFEWTCWRLQAEMHWGELGVWKVSKSMQESAAFLQTRPLFREGDVNFVYFDCSFGAEKWWFESWQQCEFIKKKVSRHPLDLLDLELPVCAEGFCIFLNRTRKRGCLQIRCGQDQYTTTLLELIFTPKTLEGFQSPTRNPMGILEPIMVERVRITKSAENTLRWSSAKVPFAALDKDYFLPCEWKECCEMDGAMVGIRDG